MTGVPQQLSLPLPIESPFDIEDLVITESNHEVAKLIEQWPEWRMPISLIVGPEGSGKSHFSSVWMKKSNAYCGHCDMFGKAVEVASTGRPILIENIQASTIDEVGLFHLINAVRQMNLVDHHMTLLMTSEYMPSQWGMKLPDLESRIKLATLVEIGQPDDILLEAILMKLFSDRQLSVDFSVVSYITRHMERSLSTARALVEEIDRQALQHKAKITRNFVIEVMAGLNAI